MTKGYKATYNYKCRNQIYEIGKEYKFIRSPVLCKRGFHYCKNAKDTLNYYSLNPDFKLLEIEDLNPNDTVTEDDKSCSNHIKIVREISDKDELYELLGQEYAYDSSRNILTYKNSDGFWRECTYNKNGKELTFKNSHGYWREFTWDEFGKELTFKNSYGYWRESTYDSNGNKLTYESGNNND